MKIFIGKKSKQLVIDGKNTTITTTNNEPCIKVDIPNVCIQNCTFEKR